MPRESPPFFSTDRRAGIVRLLWSLTAFFSLAGLVVILVSTRDARPLLAQAFDLDTEWNAPTIFQAATLLFCAVLLVRNGRASLRAARWPVIGWFALAAVFVLLATDELFGFHNRLGALVPRAWGEVPGFRYRWVVPGIAVVAAIAAASVPFLLSLPRRAALRLVAAGAVYVTGAIGFEMLAAYLHDKVGATVYDLCSVIEETLEMAGMTLFAAALLDHLAASSPREALRPPP